MTEKLYYRDAYATKFTARVLDCTEEKKHWTVILNRTLFYPEGGGQPADIGVLGGVRVLDVHERGEDIVHTTDKPLPVGAEVEGEIDWEHRFDLMQNHSGEHILSGVICGRYGCDNVGFHMGHDAVTIDLNGELNAEQLRKAELLANESIYADLPVEVSYPSPTELETLPYRSKKELTGAIRIVTIPGADVCACCGTHVKYTGEVGPIKVISAEHAKGGSRLDILIGEKALADYKCRFENTQKISALLSVKPEQTAEAAQKLLQTVADLKQELGALKLRLLEEKVDAVETGSSACVLFEQGLSTVDVRKLADKLAQKVLFAAVFNGSDTDGYQYVICASDRDVSAFGKAFNKALCGRGGGKNPMIQGQVKAEQKAIWEYLTKEGVLQDGK